MRILFSIITVCCFFNSFSQPKYWVHLNENKCGECVDQFSDWLTINNIVTSNKSHWLKAVAVKLDKIELTSLAKHHWVDSITQVKHYQVTYARQENSKEEVVDVLEQIKAQAFVKAGLNAQGVKVGVIDAGFVNVDSNELFKHLRDSNRIIAVKDFIDTEREDFYTKQTAGCNHGREVLKRITGYDESKNLLYGIATGAQFYLARTENGDKEERVEEDNWVAAIEWMHENGVKLVNTSLGYGNDFDKQEDNYITKQMDGNTAMITKAAQIAVRDKGMIIVVSAGNNGRKEWQIVTAPGDCQEVITVGATSKSSFSKVGYSSIGADFVNYIKPDVSCYSPNGTSYSAPIITGVIACLLQKNPALTSDQVKNYLTKSAHLYPFANNYVGYGVPDLQQLLRLIEQELLVETAKIVKAEGETELSLALDKEVESVVLFHKSDEWKVLRQEVKKVDLPKRVRRNDAGEEFYKEDGNIYMKIYRLPGYNFTTVQAGDQVFEIKW